MHIKTITIMKVRKDEILKGQMMLQKSIKTTCNLYKKSEITSMSLKN